MNEPSSWITRLSHQAITVPRSWKQDFKPALHSRINHALGNYFRIVNVMIVRGITWFIYQAMASLNPIMESLDVFQFLEEAFVSADCKKLPQRENWTGTLGNIKRWN